MQPPVGWIPPEHRKMMLRDLTAEELNELRESCQVYDYETDEMRPMTNQEMLNQGMRAVEGVIDTRDGSRHPNVSTAKFVRIDV